MPTLNRPSSARFVEPLEDRRLMAVTYGVNAVVNGGAETFVGTANGTNIITPTGWTANAAPTIDVWTNASYFSAAIPKPANTGNVLFVGGPNQSESDFFQTIDFSNIGTAVDAGQVNFTLAALLGGNGSQADNASVFVNFQTADHFFAGQSFVGPVTPANRGNSNGLLPRTTSDVVPSGARFAQVQIHMERVTAPYLDGYADNLSLIFVNGSVPSLSVSAHNVDSHSAAFTFNLALAPSSVAAGDLEITNLATNVTTHAATGASLSPDGKTITFILPTTLADANYRFRIPTGGVAATNGTVTAANADLNSYIFAGDANRNRQVNFDDLLILAQNYGQTGRTFSQGNFNYSADGLVNFDDLLILAQRYGTSLVVEVGASSSRIRESGWSQIEIATETRRG